MFRQESNKHVDAITPLSSYYIVHTSQ